MSGVIVTITDASTGEVIPSPQMNTPWFMTTPKSENTNISPRSRRPTLSPFTKADASQNSAAAPHMRASVSTSPETQLATRHFETGMYTPKITFAANMQA